MRHDLNRDISIGTYVLIGGIAIGIEAVGYTVTAWVTVGFLMAFLGFSLIAAAYSHLRARRRRAIGYVPKIAASACPAQMGGAKAVQTV